ncbi:AMIN-like domain-containing (lipo)protein [Streptomyces abyssomicinicus]|uniref:AMIN-like domain-containing (lipo)protein n=1 Tax=Streptomyces abyssomicinicus TaxID=574929 RepID=UPI0013DFE5FE|nr:hypothetical protein [Streptomyces abyssomicinicus]
MHHKGYRRLRASAAALAAAVLCPTAPQAAAVPETAATTAAITTTATTAATATGTASAGADCQDVCVLGVRAATHPGHDRLVIDLGRGPVPRWTTALQVGGRLAAGEGATVPVKGAEYLKITLHRATGFDFSGGRLVYTGPRHRTYGFPSLKGQGQFAYADASVREFHLGLALGEYSSYRVFALGAPNRIVVDVGH